MMIDYLSGSLHLHLHSFFLPQFESSFLVILDVCSAFEADHFCLSVQHHKGGDAIDAEPLLQILNPHLVSVGNRCERHFSVVSLKCCFITIYRTKYYLYFLLTLIKLIVNLSVEIGQSRSEETTRRCPVSSKVDTYKLCA